MNLAGMSIAADERVEGEPAKAHGLRPMTGDGRSVRPWVLLLEATGALERNVKRGQSLPAVSTLAGKAPTSATFAPGHGLPKPRLTKASLAPSGVPYRTSVTFQTEVGTSGAERSPWAG
jgi:hypothetical protein